MFVVSVRNVAGSIDRDSGHSALGEAASRALALAEELGTRLDETDPDRPRLVEVRRGDHLEISVTVLPGGLENGRSRD